MDKILVTECYRLVYLWLLSPNSLLYLFVLTVTAYCTTERHHNLIIKISREIISQQHNDKLLQVISAFRR